MEPNEPTDSAFLDIATNLLAVMLILTLFALIGGRPHSNPAAHPLAPVQSEPRFDEPQRDLFPPFSRFYFVLADHIHPWDQAAVLEDLAARPEARSGQTWQGRYEWHSDPLVTRDIDSFRLRFFVDPDALAKSPPALACDDSAALIKELLQAQQAHTAAVFIVLPEGMEVFARLYPLLRERALAFRWFAQDAAKPLVIGRDTTQFTHYVSYW